MQRHDDGNVAFQVVQEQVAAALVVHHETDPAKRFNQLLPRIGAAQSETSTCFRMAFGRDLIWFTFSSPSR